MTILGKNKAVKTKDDSLKRLFRYLGPYWKNIFIAFICGILISGLVLLPSKLVELLTDKVFLHPGEKGSFLYLNFLILAYILSIVVKGAVSYAQGYMMSWAGQNALKDMRSDVFRHIQRLPMGFFDRWRVGDIYSRATNDITLTGVISGTMITLLNNLFIILGALFMMFYRDWSMTLLSLLVSPAIGYTVSTFGKRMEKFTGILQAKVADLTSVLYESISNIKVVKSFCGEEREMGRFESKNEENLTGQMKLVQVTLTQAPIVEILAGLGIIIVVWYASFQLIRGVFNFPQLMAYVSLLVIISQPLNNITKIYTEFQQAKGAAIRVFEVLDSPSEYNVKEDVLSEMPQIKGRVEFKDLCFEYEAGKPILKNINITIEPGETVALVGHNGAGKTSLINLVSRFYRPSSGKILIDDVDITEVSLRSLRKQIGIVLQEPILFLGTIKENISYGKPGASDEEIINASKIAHAHDFIEKLQDGYNTNVGERGLGLSGGQRQRIAIARTVLTNPAIMILDEYTSGIDAESEQLITQALEEIIKGRTCFIIAHRLTTIYNADKIIVLENGKVAEVGKHKQLLDSCGPYSKFYSANLEAMEVV